MLAFPSVGPALPDGQRAVPADLGVVGRTAGRPGCRRPHRGETSTSTTIAGAAFLGTSTCSQHPIAALLAPWERY